VDIRLCDLRELEVEPGSIDIIFTDPPYPSEFLELWYDLGEFAAKALKPSGMLVAYSGQFHLPEVIQALCSHLEYVWTGSLHTPGQHNQIMQRHVRSAAKPILFFAATPAEPGPWFDDAYVSEERKKELHDWQQSPGAARYYLETLTEPGQLVCDPFLGSGTTAIVAHDLGRPFVGCDVNPDAVATARSRFA
jgi:site-specific DNA-methyltransferase (adenine-specific)